MHFFAFTSLLVGISSISMAIWIYLKGRRRKINILWAFLAIAISIWGFGGFKFTTTLDKENAFFWMRLTYIGIVFIPTLFCHFVYMLLDIERKKFITVLYSSSILFLIANFVSKDLFLGEPGIIFSSFYWPNSPGTILLLFMSYFLSLVGYGIYKLFRGYKLFSGFRSIQIKYFYFASLLGFSSGLTCFLPCFGFNFYPGIGNIGVVLYCIPMTYGITRYRLMDITVAITRTGIFMAVYSLIIGIPFVAAVKYQKLLVQTYGPNWWILLAAVMAISATVGPFIYIYLERKAERRLLYEQRRYQNTLRQAAREMARIHNLKKLLNLIVHTVTSTVRIFHSAVYLFDKKSNQYILQASHNLKKQQPNIVSEENRLVAWLRDHREPLVYDEVNRKAQESRKAIFKQVEVEMRSLNASVIVPGFLEDRMIGLLTLGEKRSGKMYSTEDLNTFTLLANQAALAIENALLYENIENQVKQRTEELVEVQKQLIQAEKLATVGTLAGGVAHEINNPLTAILTNAQMLLLNGGNIDSESRESLELIEEATKRCRSIVKKMMTYAKKPLETAQTSEVDISEVIDKVLSFLEYQLEQDNIKVVKEARKGQYLVMGSANELEQVLTNMVLNAKDAIKQEKKAGHIYILLFEDRDWIKIQIKDEGIGIEKEILTKIFDPFFTTKEVGKGLGLGLSICQSIVEKHNGLIKVQSEVNKGSVFTIRLPKIKKESKIKARV